MSTRRSPQEWRSILSAFRHSGQTQAQFCSERGLPISSLRYQLRRERYRSGDHGADPSAMPQLLEVTPFDEAVGNRPAESHRTLRFECSLDSRSVSIECQPGQISQLLAGLSTFHDQLTARR
jgi:hypothetical protein